MIPNSATDTKKGGEDGITMVLIAPSPSVQDKPASTDNTNVNGEDMTEIEENMLLPVSGQILPVRWLAQHGSEKTDHTRFAGANYAHYITHRMKNFPPLPRWYHLK
ncbi:hypothetical protein KZ779_01350 [Escherichia coli]|nr:hypothetical protein [Escherichia coli]